MMCGKIQNLTVFRTFFSLLGHFISSANCSCCSNLQMAAMALSFSSTPNICVVGLFLFSERCTYVIVFISRRKLLFRKSFSLSFCFLLFSLTIKSQVGVFSSSETMTSLTCSGHSLSGWLNQNNPVSHKQFLLSIEALYPVQYCSYFGPAIATVYLHHLLLDDLVLQSHCHDRCLQIQACYWKMFYRCHSAFSSYGC